MDVFEGERLLVPGGRLPVTGVLPGRDVGEVLVVAAGFTLGVWYSRRKWPPHDSLRSRASRQISSPSSRKSATRPAFSSDWLKEAPSPRTRTLFQNSSRSAGIFSSAVLRPSAVRAMPQYSHKILPSSRWKESTVRVPFMASSFLTRPSTAASASLKAAWSVPTFGSDDEAR